MFSLVNIFRTTELKDILIKKYIDGYWEEEDFKLLFTRTHRKATCFCSVCSRAGYHAKDIHIQECAS